MLRSDSTSDGVKVSEREEIACLTVGEFCRRLGDVVLAQELGEVCDAEFGFEAMKRFLRESDFER